MLKRKPLQKSKNLKKKEIYQIKIFKKQGTSSVPLPCRKTITKLKTF